MKRSSRNLLGVGGHRLDAYAGPWAMEPTRAQAIARFAESIDIRLHIGEQVAKRRSEQPRSQDDRPFGGSFGERLVDGIAVISVSGVLMKFVSSLDEGTSTVEIRNLVRKAARSENVRGIMLHIDSPGGTVAGTESLAIDVARAARQKPVHAYFDDLTASAALWIGSQASVISANATAVVGSIGTYMLVYDLSRLAEKEGVEAVLIRAGEPYKGAGAPGTIITQEQRDKWQQDVDALNEHFLRGVSRGRNLPIERVRELNTGELWVGQAAKAVGLVDHIESIDGAMNRLRQRIQGGEQEGSRATAETAVQVQFQAADEDADVIATRVNEELHRLAASGELHRIASAKETDMSKDNKSPAPTTTAAAPNTSATAASGSASPAGEPAEAPKSTEQQPAAAATSNAPAAPATPASSKPATLAELEAEFAQDPAFIVSVLKNGETMHQARSRHKDLRLKQLEEQNAQLKAENEQLKAAKPGAKAPEKPADKKPASTGVPAVTDRNSAAAVTGDARDELEKLVAEEQKAAEARGQELSRRDAVSRVYKKHPELAQALRCAPAA